MGSLPLGHKNRSWPSTVCKAPYSGFGTSWLLARPLRDARRGPHCCWHGTKQNGSSERQSPTAGRARTPPPAPPSAPARHTALPPRCRSRPLHVSDPVSCRKRPGEVLLPHRVCPPGEGPRLPLDGTQSRSPRACPRRGGLSQRA